MLNDAFEPIEPATTPQEMRIAISKLTRYNPLVRHVFDTAEYTGLSGEEKYVMLAYYALKQAIEFQQNYIKFLQLSPNPS